MRAALVISLLVWLAPLAARDYLPLDHGLKYAGRQGITPITVEITLREQLDGSLSYAEWTMPRGWAAWFGKPKTVRTRLRYQDERLVPLGYERADGAETPPPDLSLAALDPLATRLRARADIARGLRHARYEVWTHGDRTETWTLTVSGPETVSTPDGTYQALKFRLGSDAEWIEGWAAPLLVFHFVKIISWRDGRKLAEYSLEDKQL